MSKVNTTVIADLSLEGGIPLDYSPFGMRMSTRSFNSSEYKYGFQGQEKDAEIKGEGNSINYKYRMYDPRIGRFLSIDPLVAKYPHNSPYAFSENKVIAFVEMEGLESYFAMDGLYLGTLNNDYINKRVVDEEIAIEVQKTIEIINGTSNSFAVTLTKNENELRLLENSQPITTEFDNFYIIPLVDQASLTDSKYVDKPDIMTPDNFDSMGAQFEDAGNMVELGSMAVLRIPGGQLFGGVGLAVGKGFSLMGTGIRASVDIYTGNKDRALSRVLVTGGAELLGYGKGLSLGKGADVYTDKYTKGAFDIISEAGIQAAENDAQEKLDNN